MPYCPSCRVELAPQARNCPLCGAPSEETLEPAQTQKPMHSEMAYTPKVHNAEEMDKLTPAEIRTMAIELLSVSIGIALAVTFFIDIIVNHRLTWSAFSGVAMVSIWLYAAIPLILWKHPWITYSVLGPSTLLSIFLFFLFSGNIRWFLPVGMPLTLLLEAAIVVSGVLIVVQKKKGLNTIGVILATIAFFCAGIDITLSLSFLGKFSMGWSTIVLMAALPVSGFFFYLHYRVTKSASLRKLFRL